MSTNENEAVKNTNNSSFDMKKAMKKGGIIVGAVVLASGVGAVSSVVEYHNNSKRAVEFLVKADFQEKQMPAGKMNMDQFFYHLEVTNALLAGGKFDLSENHSEAIRNTVNAGEMINPDLMKIVTAYHITGAVEKDCYESMVNNIKDKQVLVDVAGFLEESKRTNPEHASAIRDAAKVVQKKLDEPVSVSSREDIGNLYKQVQAQLLLSDIVKQIA